MRPRKIAGVFVALLISIGLVTGGTNAAMAAPVAPSVTAPGTPAAGSLSSSKPAGVHAAKGKRGGFSALTTACGSPCYSYAGQDQTVTAADGFAINATIEKPALLSSDYHSLWEGLVQNTSGTQLVEVGWTVDLAVCGSAANTPCSFTFAWVNGVPLCYNGCGFTPAVGCAPYCMGSSLAGLVGTTKGFNIQHLGGANPGWWIAFDGVWRGAWLDTVWTGATPPATFVTADRIQSFGEVAAGNDPTQTDMGKADTLATASQGALTSSYQVVTAGVGAAGNWGSSFATSPDRWALVNVSATSFRYGGPGGNENLPTVSPTCSGVGIAPTWGGYGSMCPYGNTSGGVPISPVNALDVDASVPRNVCHPNFGKLDGITTSPIRVWENSSYVKFAWFRDANCAGAHIDIDYDKTVLPAGWTNLDHASWMRWSTPNSH